MSARRPIDGTAVLLHLVEAARAWAGVPFGAQASVRIAAETNLAAWIGELETFLEHEVPSRPEVGWEPRSWGELLSGDRVSLRGVEAVIASCAVGEWHVDPDPKIPRWTPRPLTRTVARIRLEGREQTYPMPADGEVETLRGEQGRAADEASGRIAGMVRAERDEVLASWAGEAMTTLAAAGLNPEPIAMTAPERGEA